MNFSRLVFSSFLFFALNVAITNDAHAEDIRKSMQTIASVSADILEPPDSAQAEFTTRYYDFDENRRIHSRGIADVIGVDVTYYLAVCTNDKFHVSAISMGSWQFDLDGECAGDELNDDIRIVWSRMLSDNPASRRPGRQ